jgi:hypothetical protein
MRSTGPPPPARPPVVPPRFCTVRGWRATPRHVSHGASCDRPPAHFDGVNMTHSSAPTHWHCIYCTTASMHNRMPDANAPPLHCPTASIMRYCRSAGASVPSGLAQLAWDSATELGHGSEAARTARRERGERREATLASATRRAALLARRDAYRQQSAARVRDERAAPQETRAAQIATRDRNMTAHVAVQASGAWLVKDVRFATTEGHPVPSVNASLTWADAIDALCSGSLGQFLDECLCASPHASALFWETPAFSRTTLSRPFEFVTLPAPQLARVRPDGSAFAAHFGAAQCTTATFTNLSGDATLVIPCPPPVAGVDGACDVSGDAWSGGGDTATARGGSPALHAPSHGHLGAFVHSAPAAQREALWRAVGAAAREAAKRDDPTWLSTAGSGVPWLHIRLDARPKYYHHLDYKETRLPGIVPSVDVRVEPPLRKQVSTCASNPRSGDKCRRAR